MYITKSITNKVPLDDTIGRLKDRTAVYLGSIENVTDVDRYWAALSGDPLRLDDGDIFQGLASPGIYFNEETISEKLRHHLGYSSHDQLQFEAFPLSPTAQLAMVVIVPKTVIPDAPVVIMATGFVHPSPLYIRSMQKLANALVSKVVIFDQQIGRAHV